MLLSRSNHAGLRACDGRRQRTAAAAPARSAGRRLALRVAAHGNVAAASELKKTGFVGEMRAIAMKMHTKEQAPKEGGIEAPKKQRVFAPTLAGYQQFLAESKVVYETFEDIMRDEAHPEYAKFQNTGLERSAALAADLAWLQQEYGLPAASVAEDGPGHTYAMHLRQLAADDPQYFVCHYYNFYFAHTAGGRMIGSKVADMLLGGKALAFYEYDGDVNALLDGVRASLNELAEGWSREQKDHCLKETADAFQYSGMLMRCMTEEARGA